ncbi:alpha/beta fold hydrolase [Streptomyces sp. SID3343]|uniref:esterase/lipase family protein n=1 Tax=Streptomyces sp. SID3343 TaxID=2690260 RepID=UPI001368D663|nr:alpha/beta fold hydrolase [Streptomyces sp. SID3343]MYW00928.1 alpha/beta fold hydrolase [Streptomyces sp. SID3343]
MATTWVLPSPAAANTRLPVPYSFAAGIAAQLVNPHSSPPGSNDFSCRPTATHPRPVVLVHGTLGNMVDSWQALSPLLKNNGYCVFALDYGGAPGGLFQGYGDIPTSAARLGAFVDRVRAATGTAEVDLVGHSQGGGALPRYYLQELGGAAKVHDLVGIAPSNHGAPVEGILRLLDAFPGGRQAFVDACPACAQQDFDSPFMRDLNAHPDTVAGVRYTVIESRYDEVIRPYTLAFLAGPDVRNITVQDRCGLDFSDHLALIYDRVALNEVLNALDPTRTDRVCALSLPVLGG